MTTITTPGPTPETMEATHFDIPVAHLGEEGEWMFALGHHTPRRALAAFNRHARLFIGLLNLQDCTTCYRRDWLPDIKQVWATFHAPNPENDEDPDWDWVANWATADAATPGAMPLTVLRVH
ncbi:hypothetical protein HY68_36660 [Streptomyces sp. AcH 505]|uniref:hypothetical protein n=1 Tax=Streptomyces sp. AcH 505 TaxID=352211 RepID=UPI000591D26F|nr:hypothetical protein HY68_36660 [Streptomyces sp. AcH 505]